MLPVTTQPPKRPGSWGSPFGRPTEIDLSHHPHPHPGHGSEGFYVLRKGGWYIKCGPSNSAILHYKLFDEDDHDHGHEPWREPGSGLSRAPPHRPPPPPPPHPGDNDVQVMELIAPGKAGSVFADGQNLVIQGHGEATIIEIFSV